MAIGRLDEDSEGLLLLTTCGKKSNDVRDKSVEKEYYCQVDGQITQEAIDRIKSGLEISTKGSITKTLPCDARILECSGDSLPDSIPPPTKKIRDARHGPTSWISITISEGKYRQVRKMTAAVGFPTLRLIRVRVADIDLDGLSLTMGEVREIVRNGTWPAMLEPYATPVKLGRPNHQAGDGSLLGCILFFACGTDVWCVFGGTVV